ncbi:MAG: hypothetical protein JRG89_21835, partial [Deltaproteobacteria bacterium]|nr:hypothetical protein [Deltaproteobacteria bacterium]
AITEENPRLIDIPATTMQLFGQAIPRYMQGKMILPSAGSKGDVEGMIDPTCLDQSGAAPGALIFPREESRASAKS